ncbi:hypothetical protein Tco_0377048 [Tanacetum coccineum]
MGTRVAAVSNSYLLRGGISKEVRTPRIPQSSVPPDKVGDESLSLKKELSPKFVETHNVVAFLEKPKESDGFAEIIDFLKASSVSYDLTVTPYSYTSVFEQFWATAKERSSLEMHEGIDCLNATIFEELARMGKESDSDHPTDSTQYTLLINHLHLPNPKRINHLRRLRDRRQSEDSLQLTDLMVLCTKLKTHVLDLQKAKDAQAKEIAALQKRIQRRVWVLLKDASKQGGSIEDIDADVDVSLVDETQEKQNDDLMFDSGVLEDDVMHVEAKVDGKDEQSKKPDDSTAGEAVTTASIDDSVVPTTNEEITLAQTLIQIKAAKPKVVTTAATTATTTRPKDRWVVVQEPSEFKFHKRHNLQVLKIKEKIAVLMRHQSKEREELTDKEKAKLFMELMEKRRKHFATLRAQVKRNRPPTKAQKRTQMSTYLKHMGGYTYKQLKGKSFDEIQKLFDKEMKRVKYLCSKRRSWEGKEAGKEQPKESSKKQKVEEEKESEEVDEVELKLLVIKKDEDIAIDAIPLATKLPVIIDYKLHKEGMLVHYQLIRADGSSKRYSSMIRMLQGIDTEDLEDIWRIVKAKYGDTRPENEFERVLYGDLKVMFEPDIKSDVWRILRYPLTPITITNMLNKKLQTDHQNEMCYQLLKLMVKAAKRKMKGADCWVLKRLHGVLEITDAQVKRGNYAKSAAGGKITTV